MRHPRPSDEPQHAPATNPGIEDDSCDDSDTVDRIDRSQLVPVARLFLDVIDDADRRSGGLLGSFLRPLRRLLPRGRPIRPVTPGCDGHRHRHRTVQIGQVTPRATSLA